ncbi:MAG TPA: PHP domain-containing protein [Gemmatimonadales bacterium]|nr:PHP domain-containing protein [Gemmatimonadales bacterium]
MQRSPRPGARRTGILHVHSTYSHDGRDSIARLRALALTRGIGFVGLTDHAEDLDAQRFAELCRECREQSDSAVRIIPGLEFRFAGFRGLHLLAFGLREWIAPATPEEFVALARSRADFLALAHPKLCRAEPPRTVLTGVDAVEVWNAAYNTRYLPDPKAIALLRRIRRERTNVVGFAGLDQHDGSNDRQTRVVLDRPDAEPLDELRAGRFTNEGRTMRFSGATAWDPVRLGLLYAVRAIYDRVERFQDRAARARSTRLARRAALLAKAGALNTERAAPADPLAAYRRRLLEAEAREDAQQRR